MVGFRIRIGQWLYLVIGEMDYGLLYGISIDVGRRSWSWARPTAKAKRLNSFPKR